MAGRSVSYPGVVRFAAFEVDLRTGELRKQGIKIRLQEKPFQILALLLERPGELVTREELRQKLWSADTFVDFDHSLGTAIAKLRQALGDSAQSSRFVETVGGRGYRFIAPLIASDPNPSPATAPAASPDTQVRPPADPSARRLQRVAAAIAVGLISGALLIAVFLGLNIAGSRDWLRRQSNRPVHSLAVLPLENLPADPAQDYFADGMTDALIANLAQIGNLRVISRTSAMQYKATKKPLSQIARELNVEAVLEGSVLRSENRVRITAELVDANSDTHLWAGTYERDLRDVLSLQGAVARDIAQQIRVKLTPEQHARLSGSQAVDPEAYQLYIKGRYFWVKRDQESLNRAMDYFRQAVDHDPGYAAAYSGIADCYLLFGSSFDVGGQAPSEVLPKARSAAMKALELDSGLAEPHNSIAYVRLNSDWDWPGAEAEFKRSLELNPGYSHGHHWYAHLLFSSGRTEEALAESRRALELDPLSPIINLHLGWHYLYTRQYDRALDQLAKTLELNPNYALAHWYRGLAFEQKKMYPEALNEMSRARDLLPGNLAVESDIGHVYAVSGNKREAERIISVLKRESAHRYVNLYELSSIYLGLGANDHAFESLEGAFRERSDQMIYLKVDPRLDAVRSDPRFQDLVRRVGIPD